MDWESIFQAALPELIKGGSNLVGGLWKSPDPNNEANLAYYRDRDTQTNALKQEELTQALQIAQMDAAARSAAAGATVSAAGIQAAAENNATKQRGLEASLQGGLTQAKLYNPEVRQAASKTLVDAIQHGADSTQGGYLSLAALLQNPLLHRSPPLQLGRGG